VTHSGIETPPGIALAYDALRHGALLVDLGARSRGVFHGAKAAEVVNGLVTNDVAALAPGRGAYAAALTPKGKVIADLRVLRRDGDVFVDVGEAAAPGWWAMVRKYVNPRLARFEDVSALVGSLGIFGPRARAVVESAAHQALGEVPMYSHHALQIATVPVTVARVPDGGVDGVVVYMPAEAHDTVRASLVGAGALAGDPEALEITRIEAGRPAWGVDMDESTLTQEARLDELDAVSYTKGCYTGQETVARLHFRGHVNRVLRGVRAPTGVALPRGATLLREDGTPVGDVRSSARSPRLGSIALAMVRREVEPDATLRARWGDAGEEAPVVVSELPFPS